MYNLLSEIINLEGLKSRRLEQIEPNAGCCWIPKTVSVLKFVICALKPVGCLVALGSPNVEWRRGESRDDSSADDIDAGHKRESTHGEPRQCGCVARLVLVVAEDVEAPRPNPAGHAHREQPEAEQQNAQPQFAQARLGP